jgi:RNA-binding protein YhbY
MNKKYIEMQLGKKGLTKEFVKDIEKRLEKHRNAVLKISVLKSARESKADIKKYAEELVNQLGEKFTYRVLGFSIFLKKWRKARE